MTDTTATVLVPTHEHGALLMLSVGSALEQSVDAIEVFIVCDGATDDTLDAAEELRRSDARIRVLVHDKGPRHGEVYRHQALQEGSGTIVCYLSDDDLWLPDHVANMAALLETADFAHAYPIGIDANGELFSWPGHLSVAEVRHSMLEGRNFIPLPCGAHTLELYHRLPFGWRTTPAGIHTDLYMWQQILSVEGVRLASSTEATVLHFPSSLRDDFTIEERLAELERWSAATREPGFTADINRRARENLAVAWAQTDVHDRGLTEELGHTNERLVAVVADLAATAAEFRRLTSEREGLLSDLEQAEDRAARTKDELAALEERLSDLQDQLRWIADSRTWRLRAAVLRIPGVEWLVRRVGVARSR